MRAYRRPEAVESAVLRTRACMHLTDTGPEMALELASCGRPQLVLPLKRHKGFIRGGRPASSVHAFFAR